MLLALEILSVSLHILLLRILVALLYYPYNFRAWGQAWALITLGMLLTTGHRIYVFWSLRSDLQDVLVSLVVSLSWCGGLFLFRQLLTTGVTLSVSTEAARIEIDEFSTITFWDTAAERLFGWTAAEALGQTLMQTIIPPRDWESHRRGIAAFLATENTGRALLRDFAVNTRRKDGREIPITITVSALLTPDGHRRFQGLVRELGVL